MEPVPPRPVPPPVDADPDVAGPAPVRSLTTGSRPAGLVLLLVAAVLAVTVPWALGGPIGESATRAPLPEPPAVGACLAVPVTGGLPVASPCERPHAAEVAASWRSDDPLVAQVSTFSGYLERATGRPDRAMGGMTEALVAACWSAAQRYITPPRQSAAWFAVPPRVSPALIAAPPGQYHGRWRWLACVVVTADDTSWRGSLNWQGGAPAPRPAEVSMNCQPDGSTGFARCDGPHRTEVLGWPDYAWVGSDDDRAADCRRLASSVTGRTDPTFGGRLRIEVVDRLPVPYRGALPLCVAALRGDGALIGSLIGIGDGDLPLA